MKKKTYIQPDWHFLNLHCRLSLLEISVKDGSVNSITVEGEYEGDGTDVY